MNERCEYSSRSSRFRPRLVGFSLLGFVAAVALAAVPLEAGAGHPAQEGKASWYGPGFHGKKTASGEPFDPHALTAAHRSLPLGTKAMVTNLGNGKTVEVRINDRGPHGGGRILDLSRAAARELAMNGTASVRIEVLP